MKIKNIVHSSSKESFGYADDVTINSPTFYGLQKMLNVCEEHGQELTKCTSPGASVSDPGSPGKMGFF